MTSKEKKQPDRGDNSGKSEIMHRLKTHPFLFIGTVVVLVIVVVAFVFVPAIVPEARAGGDLTFGYYNRVPVRLASGNFFSQVLSSLQRDVQSSQEDQNSLQAVYSMYRRAFNEAVIYIAMQEEVRRAGYVIPESVIDREIARQFQENGVFLAARYRALDDSTRLNLRRTTKERIAINRYTADLASLRSPSGEASFVASMASPRRTFSMAVFPFSSYPDSGLVSFADTNQALFAATRLSKITLNNEREARQVLDMVKNGTITFEEAARNNSQDSFAERGGDMGSRMGFELSGEFANEQDRETVVNLPAGVLSEVMSVPGGWAFFRLEEASQPLDSGDPAQLERIRNYMNINMRGVIEDWATAEAERFSTQAAASGFDNAAASGNVLRRDFGPISLNFGDSLLFRAVRNEGVPEFQPDFQTIGANQFFWRAAFSTPLNTPSEPFVFGNNVMVLFPLEESDEDEDFVQAVENFVPQWMERNTAWAFDSSNPSNFFLGSERFDGSRFDTTFFQSIWREN